MEEIKNKDRILEAIDQLRRRKARPDIQRICNFLLRKFSVNWQDTKTDLQRCIERGIVLKVEYKGSISYRNAAKKFSHLKQHREHSPLITYGRPNKRFVALLTNAIAELIVNEPDYVEGGVPGSELVRHILSNEDVRYSKKYISILIEKQVEQGGLIRMENGNFLPGSRNPELSNEYEMSLNEMVEDSNFEWERLKKSMKKTPPPTISYPTNKINKIHPKPSKQSKHHGNGLQRVGSRPKRAKKVFDPSDNNLPKRRGRPSGSVNKTYVEKHLSKYSNYDWNRDHKNGGSSHTDRGGVCSVCHNNKKHSYDRMICCSECSNKAHIGCLNRGQDMMLKMYPDNTWQCPHCKTCVICFETANAQGNLTVCTICADAYHSACHKPIIAENNRGSAKWVCNNCVAPEPAQLQLQANRIHPNVGSGDIIRHKLITDDSKSDIEDSSLMSDDDSCDGNSLQSPTPPTLSPQGPSRSNNSSPELKCNTSDSQSYRELDLEDIIDPSIPDASNWTCDDVYEYFLRYFPDEEARVFKEQEIDGPSLLLMKRLDVIRSLKLKLGPALKIYRHVVKLQFRREDPRLYWI